MALMFSRGVMGAIPQPGASTSTPSSRASFASAFILSIGPGSRVNGLETFPTNLALVSDDFLCLLRAADLFFDTETFKAAVCHVAEDCVHVSADVEDGYGVHAGGELLQPCLEELLEGVRAHEVRGSDRVCNGR